MRTTPVRFLATLLAAVACGGGSNPTGSGGGGPPPGPAVRTVNTTDFAFSPATLTITAGAQVQWVNTGTVSHTATSDAGVSPAFDSGGLSAPGTVTDPYGGTTPIAGGSFTATFSTPGTYPYHCIFHGTTNGMTGTITVTP